MRVKLNGNDYYEITSKFGSIDNAHHTSHTGLDLAMKIGTHLNSPIDGTISKIVDYGSNNIGKGIFIKTDDHQTVIMGHLSDIKAHVGERVHEGDFVALSGSTGHSTGGHLHLGLKDMSGQFINPQNLINSHEQIKESGVGGGVWDNITGIWDFMQKWHNVGFWRAMYGKSFFGVIEGFFAELVHDLGVFVLQNSELILVIPAIVFMIGTWIAGRNKYTKWIIPLWIVYLFSKFFYYYMID